jgi:hypothetical protein
MRRVTLFSASLVLLLCAPASSDEVSLTYWYFPLPWTMGAPLAPARTGGIDLGITASGHGWATAFPVWTTMTSRKMNFIVDFVWPFAVGHMKTGDSSPDFYAGNFRLGLRGGWKFTFPFSGGHSLPAAWGIGGDLGLPVASIWGGNEAAAMGYLMFLHDPLAWVPNVLGFSPKATFALGKPIFFMENELQFPILFGLKSGARTVVDLKWGAALGTQPLSWMAFLLEFGGIHGLNVKGNQTWCAVGARFYYKQLVAGLMMRFPFSYLASSAEPAWGLLLSFGFEKRQPQEF